ncbi:MAG: metallophosphoesterase family protein [Rhodanobacteraceae bacterium]
MRVIAHLSDLHFGRVDPAVLGPLVETVNRIGPDLIAVSGDLTQRARTSQFHAARAFLDALRAPRIVVPGNHDVPLHNLLARSVLPLTRYRRYISDDLAPFFCDDEIAVLGINTARALAFKGGRINRRQLERMRTRFAALDKDITRIIVTHHPLDLPQGHAESDLVGRAALAMDAFAHARVDVLLSGHLHVGHTGNTSVRYKVAGHAALIVQAGTATSTRSRGETNSFNTVRVDRPLIAIQRWSWHAETGTFVAEPSDDYRFSSGAWRAVNDGRTAGND